jgi:hypothetical protein
MRALIVALVCSSSVAHAYPEFQFATGSERCQACHFAPDGGGLINDFGRSEASDTISWKGDGRFLHGAWAPPERIAFGGDFRFATLANAREEDDPNLAVFPMQADLYARVAAGPITLYATGGLNGNARSRPDGAGLETYLVSREHYVMYQQEPGELYVRAGRFYPVLGLRSHDHTRLSRRALGHYLDDEPYALGGGASGGAWEFHASVFAPNPTSLAGQARFATSDDDQQILVGTVGKYWLAKPKLLLLGELDLQRQAIADTDVARIQVLAHAGVSKLMLPGLLLGVTLQHWSPDLQLGESARNTAELGLQVFPWAHVELHLIGRVGVIAGRAGSPDSLAMLQLHYYL